MCQSKHSNSTILKFADDTVIVSLLHNNESGHGPVIEEFVTWGLFHKTNLPNTPGLFQLV